MEDLLGETALITAASAYSILWQATCHAGIFWSLRLLQHTDGVRARPCSKQVRRSGLEEQAWGWARARAPAAHASQAPGIQTGACRIWTDSAGFSPLELYVRAGDHTGYRQNAKCLLYFIIIIVFASRYIAMIAGFFLKLSIKY